MHLSKPLILASNSPRRQEIMRNAGFEFNVVVMPTNEEFSAEMNVDEVAEYLANQKLACFNSLYQDSIILCADTVVIVDNQIINKPIDATDAKRMLKLLSGKRHKVITGVAVRNDAGIKSFCDVSDVSFIDLADIEIDYYIEFCKPFDKAGAYGIQDFIGMVGISAISGSFYTVMGLPIHKVYEYLKPYVVFEH